MTDAEFLQEVKRYVLAIDPQAEVWLFGSRARGDARPDSDWDFLMLTEHPVDRTFKQQVRGKLFDLELASERLIGLIIHNRTAWADLEVTDLFQNIESEGIAV